MRRQSIEKATKALILLHGRGGTAQGILGLAEEFCDDTFYIAAPQAPNNSWYPQSFMAEEKYNATALTTSVETVRSLIDATAQYIPHEHIYVMGFSQGACLALEVTARLARKYGGVVAFSGGLIGNSLDAKKYHGNYAGTKVVIGVSENDPHIPLVRAEQSQQLLEKMGADVHLLAYRGTSHTVTQEEIDWVKAHVFGRM